MLRYTAIFMPMQNKLWRIRHLKLGYISIGLYWRTACCSQKEPVAAYKAATGIVLILAVVAKKFKLSCGEREWQGHPWREDLKRPAQG